jgi:energy-coupling factor transporter ATP-binding protein EcfA2
VKLETTIVAKKHINTVSFIVGILIFSTLFLGKYKPERIIWINTLVIVSVLLSMNKIDYDYELKLLKTKKNIYLAKKRVVTQQKLNNELNNLKGIKPVLEAKIKPIERTLNVNQEVIKQELEKITVESNNDWLQTIIEKNSSFLIVGKKGFGKSHLMRYLARSYVATIGDKDLFVILDPHYDHDNPWLYQNEDELIKREKIVVNNFERKINELLAIIRYRIDNKLFYKTTNSRLRIFIDEIEFFNQFDDFTELVKVVEFEGRKFGLSIVLGGHSLKKTVCNLDSSIIGSMSILMSSNVALDPVTIKPGLFPSLTVMKKLYNQCPEKTGIGYFTDGDNFSIIKIPKLDLWEIKL